MARRKRTIGGLNGQRPPRTRSRCFSIERLENRLLLASDWQNACNALDTSGDGVVSPLDAIVPINRLNSVGSGTLPLPAPAGGPFYDTNGNGSSEPLDVLLIINALNGSPPEAVFSFLAALENDTAPGGTTNSDATTSDARLAGRVASLLGLQSLQARVDGGEALAVAHTCGSFSFDPELASDGSDDGHHIVSFTGRDPYGRERSFESTLTLDTISPSLAGWLSAGDDTGIPGDRATTSHVVTFAGRTEPFQTVSVDGMSATAAADASGDFQLPDIPLGPGVNSLSMRTSDLAGNEIVVVETAIRTPCDFDDDLTAGTVPEDLLPVAGDSIPTINPRDASLPLAAGGGGQVERVTAVLNQDFVTDVVTVSRSTAEVLVFLGAAGDLLSLPATYASGASEPVSVAVGNFVGHGFADIAVGHLDGTLTFLEGRGDGTFIERPDLSIQDLGPIVDLTRGDFDADGDTDLVVSGTDQVTLLTNDDDLLRTSPIANGDFARGLTGWTIEIAGEPAGGLRGTITPGGGVARFQENESFLVSLRQTFVVPPSPASLSFDVAGLDLEAAAGGVPDAFDVSLLDNALRSLVPTFDAGATSFLNANPDNTVSMGDGVTFDGTRVTLDISQLTPGTEATIYFDLVGNPPGTGSAVAIDNVEISPETVFVDTFTATALSGPFVGTSGVGHCDTDQDGAEDIVVEETGNGGFIVFEGDGAGGFNRADGGGGGEGEAGNRQVKIGDVVSDSIDAQGEVDVFSFDATSGQKLYFDAQDTTGLQTWNLRDSNDDIVFDQGLTDREGFIVAVTGSYTLSVSGFFGFGVGPYQFQIHETPETISTAINVNDLVAGTIGVPGETDEFTFSSGAGRVLYFDALSGIGVFQWSLTSPSSNVLFDGIFQDQGRLELTEPGTYTLLIDGELDAVGDYQFQINDVTSGLPVPIDLGEEVFGNIDIAGERELYSFDGIDGQLLFFDAHSGASSDLEVTLEDPSGTKVFDSAFQDQGSIVLQQAGAHVLTVAGVGDALGEFGYVAWHVPADVAQSILFDTPVTGAIAVPGQTRSYQFDGLTGQEIVFDEIYGPLNHIEYNLVAPSGGLVFEDIVGDKSVPALPETGTYTVSVNGSADAVGSFSFQIVDGDVPPPVPASADLVVTRVGTPRRVISTAAAFQVEWDVTNTGAVAVPAGTVITDVIHLSADGRLDDFATDPLMETFETVLAAELAPGQTVTRAETIALPEDIEAELQVLVYTDAHNVVFENQAEFGNNVLGSLVAVYREPRQLVGEPTLSLDLEDGAEFPAGTTVTLSGRTAANPAALNVIIMLDLSGSTRHITGLDANFDGALDDNDDLNSDGRVGDLLDKEIGLALATVERLRARASDVRVAVGTWTQSGVKFSDGGEPLDLAPERFNQTFYVPGRDADFNGASDLEEALRSATFHDLGITSHSGAKLFREFTIGPGNDFDQALREMLGVLDAAPAADETQVYFFADGLFFPSEDVPADDATIADVGARGIRFRAAQVASPALVAEKCSVASPPSWCAQVDPGDDFVDEIKRIAEGVDAAAGSTGNVVIAGDPDDLDDVPFTPVRIAGVAVNGFGVGSFDALGSFFTPVTLEPGDNVFKVDAFDSTGNVVQRQLTLVGVEASVPELDDFQEVTAQTGIEFKGTTFNRLTGTLHAQTVLTNHADKPLRGPVRVVFNRFNPPSLDLLDPDLVDPRGRPVVEFNGLPAEGLGPGSATEALPLEFAGAPLSRFEVDVTVLALGNAAPVFGSAPIADATLGVDYRYAAAAADPDGDLPRFRLGLAPDGMIVDPATGLVTWSPAPDQLGAHSVSLTVDDGYGGLATQSFQVNVLENPPNRPPVFRSAPPTRIDSGADYAYQPEMFDLDGDTLQFFLDAAPSGMTIDPTSGLVDFPGAAAGDHHVTIRVDDGAGGTATQAFVLTVGDVVKNASSPLILSTPPAIAAVGEPYLYLPLAQDPDGDTLAFALTTSPANMAVDPATGRLDWKPAATQLGPNAVVLRADDGRGSFATQFFTVDVQQDPPNLPPVFTTTPGRLATQDEQYVYAATAVDQDVDVLTFDQVAGPVGMTMAADTGLLVFRPDATQIGTHRVRVRVSDGNGGAGMQAFNLEVRPGPNTAPTFASVPVPDATVGATYYYNADADDPHDAVTFSLSTAPTGMTIDPSSGVVTLSPDASQIGDHDVTVRATDERGAISHQSYTLSVGADVAPPVVSVALSSTVVDPGVQIEIFVSAADNVAVDMIELAINGVPVLLNATNKATFDAIAPGLVDITGTATDRSGNLGSVTRRLRVVDPDDTTPPEINITAPSPGESVTYLTDIVGSITGSDLELYRVEYARSDRIDHENVAGDNPAWVTIAESSSEVTASILSPFDPTVLTNDDYLIRVFAQDFSGNIDVQAIPVRVAGPAKLGQFSLDFVDVSIPLAGIPIEVTRRYNSFDAGDHGDFGFGWTLGIADADVRETVSPNQEAGRFGATQDLFSATPFVFGTRVYLTDPDGKRVGFTFEPERTASFFGAAYTPKFTPDPGVYDELEVDPITLAQRDDGSFAAFLFDFPYNPNIFRLVRPDGTVYQYDQFDGLQSATDRNGNQLLYSPEGITHSSGESIEFVRDALGRITEIIDPNGNSITYDYDSRGDLVAVSNQEGMTTRFTYLITPAHYLDEVSDPSGGTATRTEYDDQGRIVATVDALGNRIEESWDPANFHGTIIDANGGVTRLTYDARGNVLEQIDPLDGAILYSYDDPNNPDLETAITDQVGNTTRYAYDDRGNMLTRTDALGGVTAFTYDSFGNVTSVTDALGRETRATYDDNGKMSKFVSSAGDQWSFAHDSQGRLTKQTDPLGHSFSLVYGHGTASPSKIINRDGTAVTYATNVFGAVTQVTDESGNVTSYEYDDTGRLVSRLDGLENKTVFGYDAHRLQSMTDASGNTTLYEYDDNDRVVRETRPSGASTTFAYDANGNRTSVSDPVGNVTTFGYDASNRRTHRTDPLGGVTTYEYDASGNTIEMVDRRGRPTKFEYDALNRVTTETWYDDDSVVNEITTTYDATGNRLAVSDSVSSYAFEYDSRNRIVSVDNAGTAEVPHTVLNYEYDGNGNRVSASDHTGVVVETTFDSRERLLSRIWRNGGIDPARADLAYDADGGRTIDRFADVEGLELVARTTSDSNAVGRTTQIRHINALDEVLAEYGYTYDPIDRLIGAVHHGESYEYEYDAADQLVLAKQSSVEVEEFTYDLNGNRTATGHVVGENNRLLSDGAFDYEYDPEGNLVGKKESATGIETTYRYDHRNRLIGVEERTAEGVLLKDVDFGYDVLDRRVIKTSAAGVLVTVYDGQSAWADFDGAGNLVARYLSGDLIDMPLARYRPGEGTTWYLSDRLRTVRELSDSTGNVVAHLDYDSFGSPIGAVDHERVGRFGFTGREFDPETGLYYYRARYYDPRVGRFLGEDPLGFAAGDANLHRYVGNSPTNAIDPTGLATANEYGTKSSATSLWQQAACEALGTAAGAAVGAGFASSRLLSFLAIGAEQTTQTVVTAVCLKIPNVSIPKPKPVPSKPSPPKRPAPNPQPDDWDEVPTELKVAPVDLTPLKYPSKPNPFRFTPGPGPALPTGGWL